jgi:molybdate transport system substrate-binding protein
LTGCSRKETQGESVELVVLCGSSFVPPTEQLYTEFSAKTGIKIVSTTAGSEDFLPLVKTGQKGDILVTHDPYLDYVRDASALTDHAQVGFVAPVLVVQKGNPKGIKSIEDLTKGDGFCPPGQEGHKRRRHEERRKPSDQGTQQYRELPQN